jgi:hypothetical protein
MNKYKAKFVEVHNLSDIVRELESIRCDSKSIDIMAPKGIFRIIKMDDIKPRDAIIIKQDMLSIGGEVAIPRDVFDMGKEEKVSILIMGTLKQLKELTGKLRRHYKSVHDVGNEIELLIRKEFR